MKTIQVRTTFEGVHSYPGAPEEVAYLRQPHRHIFGVCVEVEVFHDDRELEFIMVKHMIDMYFGNLSIKHGCRQLGTHSCEKISSGLFDYLWTKVTVPHLRYWKVTVDEDGENGASITYNKQ